MAHEGLRGIRSVPSRNGRSGAAPRHRPVSRLRGPPPLRRVQHVLLYRREIPINQIYSSSLRPPHRTVSNSACDFPLHPRERTCWFRTQPPSHRRSPSQLVSNVALQILEPFFNRLHHQSTNLKDLKDLMDLICTVVLDPRDPLLQSERTQGFAADPDYWKGEVFAYVGLPQNLKDLKVVYLSILVDI